MAGTEKSRCHVCGGAGQVEVEGGDWDHRVWDVCLACEDQWCRDRRCLTDPGQPARHLKHHIRERNAA